MKKIYTEKSRCSLCRKVVEEYSKDNRSRTIKSWTRICLTCFNNLLREIALSMKAKGRGLGVGIVEELFEAQRK